MPESGKADLTENTQHTTMTYQQLIERKSIKQCDHGLKEVPPLGDYLFDYQKTVTEFALKKGRAALFLDTGLGKTRCQIEWAKHVPGKKLILAPLAVAAQTVREGKAIGVDILHSRDGSTSDGITITNYERLHLFNADEFNGVVLDESSILKSFMGKTKNQLCDTFSQTPFRLCCSATPAPNDYMELGNHSDFLGVMPSNEMLTRWFINDTMNFGSYRLKGHAIQSFWEWVASWAACAGKPSDAGGDDSRHILPPLTTNLHCVDSVMESDIDEGWLFKSAQLTATTMHADKRATLKERVEKARQLASTGDYCLIWCESNDESEALRKAIPDSVEVKGADSADSKEEKLEAFSAGKVRVLISKASICGFGLNFQHCNHVIFASISYSYEQFYQAIRRTWRFGQKRPVRVDCIIANSEQPIWQTIQAKLSAHDQMKGAMKFASMDRQRSHNIKQTYKPTHEGILPIWLKTK